MSEISSLTAAQATPTVPQSSRGYLTPTPTTLAFAEVYTDATAQSDPAPTVDATAKQEAARALQASFRATTGSIYGLIDTMGEKPLTALAALQDAIVDARNPIAALMERLHELQAALRDAEQLHTDALKDPLLADFPELKQDIADLGDACADLRQAIADLEAIIEEQRARLAQPKDTVA